jgi:two-component system, LytTR family, response regulator
LDRSGGHYARIWIDGRSYLLREAMHHLERRVRAHGFARAHRRALVRIGSVRELKWTDAGAPMAVLGSGATIKISRRRRAAGLRSLCSGG